MKRYNIIFEDIFSFATDTKTVELTEAQYTSAVGSMQSKAMVVNKYNDKTGIRTQLIIKHITPFN